MSTTAINVLGQTPSLNFPPEQYAMRAAQSSYVRHFSEPASLGYAPPVPDEVTGLGYAPVPNEVPSSSYAPVPDGDADNFEDHLAEAGGEPHGAPDSYWAQIVQLENRRLQGVYEREKEDSKHRMGDLLAACFKIYQQVTGKKGQEPRPALDPRGELVGKGPKSPYRWKGATGAKTFYEWLDSIPEWERVEMIRTTLTTMSQTPDAIKPVRAVGRPLADISRFGLRGPDRTQNINPSMVRAFLYGVRYLDHAARKGYRLTFSGGLASRNGNLFDTSGMRTVFSGPGSAIWVQSPKDNFYAGDHIKGQFHHSSFLSGGEVKCGGEMQATQGKITRISAKSGHYQPTAGHFAIALLALEQLGLNLSAVKVVVWAVTRPDSMASLISGADFLVDPRKWEVWGTGPVPRNG